MKNIVNILIISFFLYSCIEIIKTSDTDVYESIHIQGSGWFEFYENNENESLILPNDFTFQVWFSGENQHNNEAQCIISLIGNNSSIAIYKNPSIENRIMIYNNDNLIQELDLESMNFNNEQNFYLLSIINTENQITIYINDMVITNDDSSPLIINSDDNLKPTIGAILNNNYPKNLWYGYIDEIRIWNTALHDTIISFHNQYPTNISSSYDDIYLESLIGLWNFKINKSENNIDHIFQDINENLMYTIIYSLESMNNELSELSR